LDPSSLLQKVKKREPSALEQLIENTYQEGYARVGGDLSLLTSVYRTLLAHLPEIGTRTGFWPYWWHDQPDEDTGSDRSERVQGIWRNYKMRVAYTGWNPNSPTDSLTWPTTPIWKRASRVGCLVC
jgi:hypothetical protein